MDPSVSSPPRMGANPRRIAAAVPPLLPPREALIICRDCEPGQTRYCWWSTRMNSFIHANWGLAARWRRLPSAPLPPVHLSPAGNARQRRRFSGPSDNPGFTLSLTGMAEPNSGPAVAPLRALPVACAGQYFHYPLGLPRIKALSVALRCASRQQRTVIRSPSARLAPCSGHRAPRSTRLSGKVADRLESPWAVPLRKPRPRCGYSNRH